MKKVSIVIPVYNVEKYISECLESLANQTYSNLEIIVIDDETKDSSGRIADSFAKEDPRFVVKHIKNRGAAGARNVGLDLVTGDYIMFVDSDDWVEPDTVEIMVNKLESTGSEMVMCQYYDEYLHCSNSHSIVDEEHSYNSLEAMREYINHWEYPLIWNKIYRAELIGDIRFVEGRCIDDEFFTYQLFAKIKKFFLIPDILYHYRQRKSGAMRNPEKVKQRSRDQVDFVTLRYISLKDRFPVLRARLLEHMCEVYMLVLRNTEPSSYEYKYAKKHLRKYSKKALLMPIENNIKKAIIYHLFKKNLIGDSSVTEENQSDFFD